MTAAYPLPPRLRHYAQHAPWLSSMHAQKKVEGYEVVYEVENQVLESPKMTGSAGKMNRE